MKNNSRYYAIRKLNRPIVGSISPSTNDFNFTNSIRSRKNMVHNSNASMRQKILMIENDEVFRWQLLHFLGDHYYRTIEAEDGLTGLKLARDHQPDLVLCAINMPCYSGYDVLRLFRQHQELSSIPFVFLTRRGEYERKVALHAGATDLLTKALSFNQVLKRLRLHLKDAHYTDSTMIEPVTPEVH